jgi:hypothetical protein
VDKVLRELRAFVAYQVKEGFDSEQVIVENAEQLARESHGRDDLRAEIERIVAECLAAHLQEQSHWQVPTDCDRLNNAFASLNRLGIVARQNFSCCTNCGHSDIWEEIEQEEATNPVDGYVFYHLQCTERAIKSRQLFLAYGSTEDDDEVLKRVGNTIVRELKMTGLDAQWDGRTSSAIVIEGLEWRRRR